MEANLHMIVAMEDGQHFRHEEMVDPFDEIMIVSKARFDSGRFELQTYEDGSIIETQFAVSQKDMLSKMRRIGRYWE